MATRFIVANRWPLLIGVERTGRAGSLGFCPRLIGRPVGWVGVAVFVLAPTAPDDHLGAGPHGGAVEPGEGERGVLERSPPVGGRDVGGGRGGFAVVVGTPPGEYPVSGPHPRLAGHASASCSTLGKGPPLVGTGVV